MQSLTLARRAALPTMAARPARRAALRVCKSAAGDGENNATPVANNTVFYGGATYSEAEVRAAAPRVLRCWALPTRKKLPPLRRLPRIPA